MRTNIEIDDALIREVQAVTNTRTKRAAVDLALRELLASRSRAEILGIRGKVRWVGDLEESRKGRV